jgi:glycosyltransferase involved in cell wall biosynthesis
VIARDYDTALRPHLQKRLEEIREADILVGIPCYNNEDTIVHVIQMVSHGIHEHYRDRRAVIMVADGGSTDDTRDVVQDFQLRPWQEKIVTIYRGLGGKGTALRAIFESAYRLKVRACACVDSDLRSINPDWVKYLLEPVLEKDYEYVAPVYSRYKYDGTITNNIVYNLVRALYGKRIRQPIGGDFAFSHRLARQYLEQEVWATDIARFGIDIWMTTNAIVENTKICQANLGVKIHDAKDPAEALGPMFRQVCGTIFSLMEQHENFWMPITASDPVPTFGMEERLEPEPIQVNQPRMVQEYNEGLRLFGSVYREIFSDEVFRALEEAGQMTPDTFHFHTEVWVKLLYELAAKHHHLADHRMKLLTVMTPLYLGRVASFITRTRDMDSQGAEDVVEEQAEVFEALKPYLVELWRQQANPRDLGRALSDRS